MCSVSHGWSPILTHTFIVLIDASHPGCAQQLPVHRRLQAQIVLVILRMPAAHTRLPVPLPCLVCVPQRQCSTRIAMRCKGAGEGATGCQLLAHTRPVFMQRL